MTTMLARQRVAGFTGCRRVFHSHAEAQHESGLEVQRILRNQADPSEIYVLFKVTDIEAARAFVTSTERPDAQQESGVMGDTEIVFLDEAASGTKSQSTTHA